MIALLNTTARTIEAARRSEDELDVEALSAVSGGAKSSPTYVQNKTTGDWYIITHNKNGQTTGITNVGPCG